MSAGENGTTENPTGTTQSETVTVSETDTGEETSTESDELPEYPLGLSNDGVDRLLFSEHTRTLAGTSFRTAWTRINRSKSEIDLERTYRVADNHAIGEWVNENGGTLTMIRINDGGFWREDLGDKYTYGESRDGFSMRLLAQEQWILPLIAAANWNEPTLVQDSGPAIWEVTMSDLVQTTPVPGYFQGELQSVSGSMEVDERGVIHSFQGRFGLTGPNVQPDVLRYQIQYSVDAIGEVSVSVPGWLSTAKDRRPIVEAAITDDQNYVRFTLSSGNQLEPGTQFTVYDEVNRLNFTETVIDEAITPGETVYFYKETADPLGGKISRGSRPQDASPVTLSEEYHMWASRGNVEYFGTVSL